MMPRWRSSGRWGREFPSLWPAIAPARTSPPESRWHIAAPALRAQLLIYPMIDATCSMPSYAEFAEGYGPGAADMKRGWNEYLPAGADPRDPRASPLFATQFDGAPPALVLTAEYDTLRDEGEAYAQKLGGSVREYPGTIHGFFTMPGILRVAREAMKDAAAFLKRHW